jgi:hypothetical protein
MTADPRLDRIAAEIRNASSAIPAPATRKAIKIAADGLHTELPDLTTQQIGAVLLWTATTLSQLNQLGPTLGTPGAVYVTNFVAMLGHHLYTNQTQTTDTQEH